MASAETIDRLTTTRPMRKARSLVPGSSASSARGIERVACGASGRSPASRMFFQAVQHRPVDAAVRHRAVCRCAPRRFARPRCHAAPSAPSLAVVVAATTLQPRDDLVRYHGICAPVCSKTVTLTVAVWHFRDKPCRFSLGAADASRWDGNKPAGCYLSRRRSARGDQETCGTSRSLRSAFRPMAGIT